MYGSFPGLPRKWGYRPLVLPRDKKNLASWMVLFVHLFQMLPADMGVDLGCGNVRMPEHDLNASQVRAAFQKMAGKRMTQRMRGDVSLYTRAQGISFDHFLETLPCHGPG